MTQVAVLSDRAIIEIGGAEAREFLQGLVTANLDDVTDGKGIYALLQTPQGKYLFDFFLLADGEGLLLDCDAARAPDLLKRLMFYKLRADVTLKAGTTWQVAASWDGPAPEDVLEIADPRLTTLGARHYLRDGETLTVNADIADYDAHRLMLGVPGPDDLIPDDTFPLEAGLDKLNAIDFQKGCFVGQEVTSRTHRRGSVRKRIIPVTVNGSLAATGSDILAGERKAGTLLSGSGDRALALLRLDRLGDTLTCEGASITPAPVDWLDLPEETSAS